MKEELLAEDKKVSEPKDRGNFHTYYDGKEQRRVMILPEYIAEFSSGKSKFKDFDKSSQTVMEGTRVKIYKIGNSTLKNSLQKGLIPTSISANGDFSPVFSSTGSDTNLMTLPGSIIVELDRDLGNTEAESFGKENKIKFLKKLPLTNSNYYVFETSPGLPCLDKANELRNRPGVLSASPEWFQKGFTR